MNDSEHSSLLFVFTFCHFWMSQDTEEGSYLNPVQIGVTVKRSQRIRTTCLCPYTGWVHLCLGKGRVVSKPWVTQRLDWILPYSAGWGACGPSKSGTAGVCDCLIENLKGTQGGKTHAFFSSLEKSDCKDCNSRVWEFWSIAHLLISFC
jgi:hypothetical protein